MPLHSIARLRKEYSGQLLDPSLMNEDPMVQMTTWLEEAIRAGVPEPNAMILSTVSAKGQPSGRIVLLKGIEQNRLVFFTNYESRKGREIAGNNKVALTFCWHEIQRQVRIEGKATRLTKAENQEYFSSRPMNSRISACISPQSQVIPDRQVLEILHQSMILDLDGSDPVCPPDWGGFQVSVSAIEFWQGREHRLHDRIRYRKSGNKWVSERLAP